MCLPVLASFINCKDLTINPIHTFTAGATALSRASFGPGMGAIVLDDLSCSGTENSLFECPHTAAHNCLHVEDAGVQCLPGTIIRSSIRI